MSAAESFRDADVTSRRWQLVTAADGGRESRVHLAPVGGLFTVCGKPVSAALVAGSELTCECRSCGRSAVARSHMSVLWSAFVSGWVPGGVS